MEFEKRVALTEANIKDLKTSMESGFERLEDLMEDTVRARIRVFRKLLNVIRVFGVMVYGQ